MAQLQKQRKYELRYRGGAIGRDVGNHDLELAASLHVDDVVSYEEYPDIRLFLNCPRICADRFVLVVKTISASCARVTI
jgi:hypothetical protein